MLSLVVFECIVYVHNIQFAAVEGDTKALCGMFSSISAGGDSR